MPEREARKRVHHKEGNKRRTGGMSRYTSQHARPKKGTHHKRDPRKGGKFTLVLYVPCEECSCLNEICSRGKLPQTQVGCTTFFNTFCTSPARYAFIDTAWPMRKGKERPARVTHLTESISTNPSPYCPTTSLHLNRVSWCIFQQGVRGRLRCSFVRVLLVHSCGYCSCRCRHKVDVAMYIAVELLPLVCMLPKRQRPRYHWRDNVPRKC